ncbi:MAG: hypothetical protein HYX66_08950 [Ignavibacteria bacterium]|nr:hypothetical protein [Ignavibacteria bacterium]
MKKRKNRTTSFRSTKATRQGQKFMANIAKVYTDKNSLRDIGGLFLGVAVYALVPTAIQKFFKTDMSGWKGIATGLLAGSLAAGFGSWAPAVTAGTIAAFFGHWMWTKLNGQIVYPALKTYLWRWDPTAKDLGGQPAPNALGEDVANGRVSFVDVGGRRFPVITSPPRKLLPESKSTALSEYVERMGGTSLADYQDRLEQGPENPAMADYTQSINEDERLTMDDYIQRLGDNDFGGDPNYEQYADMM